VRNLGLIIAFWLAAVLPTGSHALGLGEIEVSSFLNQPLKAEIEVMSARPGEIDDLLVSLASREAFTRAGLARPRHLTDLRFSVNKSEEGDTATILVTTKASVKEPFLNFLLEADWSKGRILREFTVLLDPPFYAEQPAPAETMTQDSMPASDDSSDMTEPVPEPEATSSDAAEQAVASSETITEPIALSESTSSESAPS
jgi:pilus assembly protein FimV